MNDKPASESPEVVTSKGIGSSPLLGSVVWKSECGRVTLYNADCRDVLPTLANVDAVISDPPYPNAAGHFTESVKAARDFIARYTCGHWMLFWDEMESPPCGLPMVAKHIWHRSNTNRPDNYEPIYEYHADGKKRASRVLPYPVIFPGLTGCVEATGHPTQKNVKLMMKLIELAKAESVIDPFMGSGSTGVAAVKMGRRFIGIERDAKHYADALARIKNELSQGDLFLDSALPNDKAET
jgi:DNA modification methylase